MNELLKIRNYLKEMAEKEATQLYRLAWRAKDHGCSQETIDNIRSEANELHMTAYPERLVSSEFKYAHKYAFKC